MADIKYLSDQEVEDFLSSLDADNDGFIAYAEVEAKLDQVHLELAPTADPNSLHHEDRNELDRHDFLRRLTGTNQKSIPVADFASIVHSWKVPSPAQDERHEQEAQAYVRSLALGRQLRAYWSVYGPKVICIGVVISMQSALGVWECVKYATQPQWQKALGWGVVLSKTSAGILYTTLFFLIISMSRWLGTFLRRFYHLSRVLNWDLSQEFHILISITALFFATTHSIGHLTGTFLYGSRPSREDAVAALFGPGYVPRPYRVYVASVPGWSGIIAYAIFWIIALTSLPIIRRQHYEIFQLAHLLMFVMIAMLMFHGTKALLQRPMLGYFLAFPTLLVICERLLRLFRGFYRIPARLDILDHDTISFFQWHPITISSHIGDEIKVHIKTDGNWTSKLRSIEERTGVALEYVGIDGPFGAPAQRFKDYDTTIVVGSGIGITPFAGILADLQSRENEKSLLEHRVATPSPTKESTDSTEELEITAAEEEKPPPISSLRAHRRVDFHWIVRDRNYFLWFSDLLNRICDPSAGHRMDCLDIRIRTHVTQRGADIATHIFRFLLEQHRTALHPASPLTGLINPTNFGRPDLARIMEEHYESMLQQLVRSRKDGEQGKQTSKEKRRGRRVGVFFCGAASLGCVLADQCWLLTLRGREDRSLIRYEFMMEVFG